MHEYYANSSVRQRIIEYPGGDSLEEASCRYLTRCDTRSCDHLNVKRPEELDALEHGFDVGRSLWDRRAVIAHLDIDYVNFDFPAEPYLDLPRTFDLQEPLVAAIKEVLAGFHIFPLHLMSGRGHHFVWQIMQHSAAFTRLLELGSLFPPATNSYKQPCFNQGERVADAFNQAFTGLGLITEFIAHRAKNRAAPHCRLPVKLTADIAGHRLASPPYRRARPIEIRTGSRLGTLLVHLQSGEPGGLLHPALRRRLPYRHGRAGGFQLSLHQGKADCEHGPITHRPRPSLRRPM